MVLVVICRTLLVQPDILRNLDARIGIARQYIDSLAKIPLVPLQHNQVNPLIQGADLSSVFDRSVTGVNLIWRNVVDGLVEAKP